MKIYQVDITEGRRSWGADTSIIAAHTEEQAEAIYVAKYPGLTVRATELGIANDDVEEGFILDGYWE